MLDSEEFVKNFKDLLNKFFHKKNKLSLNVNSNSKIDNIFNIDTEKGFVESCEDISNSFKNMKVNKSDYNLSQENDNSRYFKEVKSNNNYNNNTSSGNINIQRCIDCNDEIPSNPFKPRCILCWKINKRLY